MVHELAAVRSRLRGDPMTSPHPALHRFTGRLLASLAMALFAAAPCIAHQGAGEQILALDERIAARPGDATLHLRRGELHRVHRNWEAARADYDRSRGLDPGLALVDFCRGRMWFEAGEPRRSLTALDRYLRYVPADPSALANRIFSAVASRSPANAASLTWEIRRNPGNADAAVSGPPDRPAVSPVAFSLPSGIC